MSRSTHLVTYKHSICCLQQIFTQVMLPTNFTWVMLLRFGTFAYQIANAAEWVVVRTLQEKTFLPIITAAAARCCIPILSAKQRQEEHTVLRLPMHKIAENIVPQMHHHQLFLSLFDSLALHLHKDASFKWPLQHTYQLLQSVHRCSPSHHVVARNWNQALAAGRWQKLEAFFFYSWIGSNDICVLIFNFVQKKQCLLACSPTVISRKQSKRQFWHECQPHQCHGLLPHNPNPPPTRHVKNNDVS